ncbi:TetR family transcriptional regulator [Pseudosporangium ferrugineum]|uniref:TetR family transcriptional regulator n=1 Tax=Pseudosporangium ferrugineum TaxID=439699 RepID=A0A2T0RXC8_9ACTN|nr:TetR family transcriptional regulator [Pseudosporangium ferrugineum]
MAYVKQQAAAPLRADARRNREQIIEAARAMFLREGTDVPMEEIARAAGVGIGTLYRRFPDRGELIKAVSLDNLERMNELAARLEREEPDPAAALEALLRAVRDQYLGIVLTSAAAMAFRAAGDLPAIEERRDELLGVIDRLLHRAQEQGAVRRDVRAGDVLLMLVAVSRMLPAGGDGLGAMVFERLFALMLDGFRPRAESPLPGRPVGYDDVEHLRRHGIIAGLGRAAER